LNCCLWSR